MTLYLLAFLTVVGLALAIVATIRHERHAEERRESILGPLRQDIECFREQGEYSKALELMDKLLAELPDDFDLSNTQGISSGRGRRDALRSNSGGKHARAQAVRDMTRLLDLGHA